jgi:cytochrome c oxidase assembly protein subunit 11
VNSLAQKNRAVGVRAALFGLAMLVLAFAAVPLYRIFCQRLGFGGTTIKERRPARWPRQSGLLDANIRRCCRGNLCAEQEVVRIHPGARTTIYT